MFSTESIRNQYHNSHRFCPRRRNSRRLVGLTPDVLWWPLGEGPFGPKHIWTQQEHEEYDQLKKETEDQWQRRQEFKRWMDEKNRQKRERSTRAAKRLIRSYRCIRGVWKNARDNEREKKRVKVECKDYESS